MCYSKVGPRASPCNAPGVYNAPGQHNTSAQGIVIWWSIPNHHLGLQYAVLHTVQLRLSYCGPRGEPLANSYTSHLGIRTVGRGLAYICNNIEAVARLVFWYKLAPRLVSIGRPLNYSKILSQGPRSLCPLYLLLLWSSFAIMVNIWTWRALPIKLWCHCSSLVSSPPLLCNSCKWLPSLNTLVSNYWHTN